MTIRFSNLAFLALSVSLIATTASAERVTLTFDDVSSLDEYAPLDVTFSNIMLHAAH